MYATWACLIWNKHQHLHSNAMLPLRRVLTKKHLIETGEWKYTPRTSHRWILRQYYLRWCHSSSCPNLRWHLGEGADAAAVAAKNKSSRAWSATKKLDRPPTRASSQADGVPEAPARPVHLCAQVNRTGEGFCSSGTEEEELEVQERPGRTSPVLLVAAEYIICERESNVRSHQPRCLIS